MAANVYDGLAKLGDLVLDCTISEHHTLAVQVTDHPVERGANVTDHARELPRVLSIEGIISNTPTLPVELLPAGYATRAEAAFAYLESLARDRKLIPIVTSLKVYENMLLTSAAIPRDAKTGDALRFTAQAKELVIRQSKTALVTTSAPNGQPRRDKGKQGTKDADAATEDDASILKGLLNEWGVMKPGSGKRN